MPVSWWMNPWVGRATTRSHSNRQRQIEQMRKVRALAVISTPTSSAAALILHPAS
jgi:hypothetical protein